MIWVIVLTRILNPTGAYEDVIVMHAAYETQESCQTELDGMTQKGIANNDWRCTTLATVKKMSPDFQPPHSLPDPTHRG
jgi:hypothetical protein